MLSFVFSTLLHACCFCSWSFECMWVFIRWNCGSIYKELWVHVDVFVAAVLGILGHHWMHLWMPVWCHLGAFGAPWVQLGCFQLRFGSEYVCLYCEITILCMCF